MRHEHPRFFWRLATLILSGMPTLASAAEAPPSWVFFADRGRDHGALSVAIDDRATELSPRALARRKRVRGDRGVDARDLAPASAYVAAVLGTGARLRSSSRWLNAISVDADTTQLAAIAALPAVVHLQPVARRRNVAPLAPLRSHDSPDLAAAPHWSADAEDYGVAFDQLDLLQIPFLHNCGLTGAGVVVGVQDSGFSLQHAALMGVDVIAAHDFINDDDIVANEPGDPKGQHNHGTMVLSLLAGNDPGNYMGAAPGISVILSKTEDSSVEEPFEEDRFVEGLEWTESMGADLFTTSLGYADWYAPQDLDGKTAVTTKAAAVAVAQGLIIFSAVGNVGPEPMTLMAPSDADGLIAVGAVDFDGVVAEFSSRGPSADGRIKPDIAAPGQDVWVASPNSQVAYGQGDGTSLATPLAAGAAALLMEAFPDLDPMSMRAMLQQSSSLAAMPNNDLGWGVLDARLPVATFCACAGDDVASACADDGDSDSDSDSDGDASTGGGTSGDSSTDDIPTSSGPDASDAGGSASSDGATADLTRGAADEGEGCTCSSARETWSPALLLPWLLLGMRRRRA